MSSAEPPGSPDRAALRHEAELAGLAFVETVTDDMLDPSLVVHVPVEWARANVLLPVRMDGRMCVLTADPSPMGGVEDVALLIGRSVTSVIAAREVILQAIERCYFRREDSAERFVQDHLDDGDARARARTQADDLLLVARQAPVMQLVNLILLEAVRRDASDIHIEPFEDRLRVRYRVDGVLYEQASPPKSVEESLVSRVKVMAKMDIAEKRLPQDGMARVRVGDREIDIRVSTVPVAEGERVVMRLLNRDSSMLPLSALGMPDGLRGAFERLMALPNGMIVVSGPTGSGKTTSLYAALGQVDSSRRNILTIEEPIEYQLPNIGQIQVKPKIGLTFAVGLRHILRQDPDVVLVGETRDLETAEIAVRASLTGHLVLTTLHTNDAPGAVTRLLDMGVEPFLLASCLRGVLAQRLVRRLCPSCRRLEPLSDAERRSGGALAARIQPGMAVGTAVGCASCLEGYRQRIGIFELMTLDRVLQEAVRQGHAGVESLRQKAIAAGMHTLADDGIAKAQAGVTSFAEVHAAMFS